MQIAGEGFFSSFDSTSLFFRSWKPAQASTNRALILLHRGHEHSGRMQEIVDGLEMTDQWAFAYDFRGHGRSPGPRGYAPDFTTMVQDLEAFVRFVEKTYHIPVENMTIVANSVGAVIASTWLHDFAPRIRAMVLAAPAFKVKLYVPFAMAGLRLLNLIKQPAFISSYVKSKMLTHDPLEMKKYDSDPLITRDIAVNILLGLFDHSKRVIANAGAITTPTLIFSAGSDYVVSGKAQRKFFERLSSPNKEFIELPKFFHGVFFEKERAKIFSKTREFIMEAFQQPVDRSELLLADRESASAETFHDLLRPPSILKALYFGFSRRMISTFGSLSQGIRIGLETGFDSGKSLDYIYENRARGFGPVGKLIDFIYLNAVGWKGIRQRKIHIEKSISMAIKDLLDQKQEVRILDVAGGPGRYLLDIAKKFQGQPLKVLIRDNVEGNLQHGREVASSMGLSNVNYENADAFALKTFKDYQPNIVIVSGFFELIPGNEKIAMCIRQLARDSAAGAYLIYTGQAYHPQQEMIARTLTNREGQPWIMRLRSQAELDELFRMRGFVKQNMSIDQYGIFTVSLAQKMSPSSEASVSMDAPSNSNMIKNEVSL